MQLNSFTKPTYWNYKIKYSLTPVNTSIKLYTEMYMRTYINFLKWTKEKKLVSQWNINGHNEQLRVLTSQVIDQRFSTGGLWLSWEATGLRPEGRRPLTVRPRADKEKCNSECRNLECIIKVTRLWSWGRSFLINSSGRWGQSGQTSAVWRPRIIGSSNFWFTKLER